MRILLLTVVCLIALGGCGGEDWQTKNISGLMPKLEFRLSSAGEGPLTEDALHGRVVLLTFGFTSCPDVCPDTLARLAAVRGELPERLAESVQIVFVSVDPERDDPERLAGYARHFDEDALGVTGTEQELRELTRRYRATYSRGEADASGYYPVSHALGVYVFDGEGEARLLFRPSDSVKAMSADIHRIIHSRAGSQSSVER